MYVQLGVWISLCCRVSVLHFWETCYHGSLISQREGKPRPELGSCSRRKQLSRKQIISRSVNTELPFLYGEIHSTCAAPGLRSTKHMKIPFKHTLQFRLKQCQCLAAPFSQRRSSEVWSSDFVHWPLSLHPPPSHLWGQLGSVTSCEMQVGFPTWTHLWSTFACLANLLNGFLY